MPHLIWTRRAEADLGRLYSFLSLHSDSAATRAMKRIYGGVMELSRYSASGRPVPFRRGARREWIIPFGKGAYIVAYDVRQEEIRILAIRHSREDSEQRPK